MRLRAFTLIEMMVSIALGLVICYAGYAAFRMCAQSITVVNRLSLENSLMRAGLLAAVEELDLWTTYDDPNDPASQILRQPGRPFAPLDVRGHGFDTDFDQSDPKTWYRGPTSKFFSSDFYADHSIHAGLAYSDPADAQAQYDHRWSANLISTLMDQIGYYGFHDYVPANAILLYYDETGKIPLRQYDAFNPQVYAANNPIKALQGTSGWGYVRDVVGGIACSFTVTRNPDYLSRDVDHHYFWLWKHINFFEEDLWQSQKIQDECGEPIVLMPHSPETWPKVTVRTHHTMYSGRETNNASLVLASPITGQSIKLFITSTTTTLRGARRQRGLDTNELP